MKNWKEITRIIIQRKKTRQMKLAKDRMNRESAALSLILAYRESYELLSDAIFLGQLNTEEKAWAYVRTFGGKVPRDHFERKELLRLAATQNV